ncbi:MAG: glycerate kinase [Chitinophagaceae bacterium]|nr:glycerate kinase [Chitinophagaceae bacterium]
MHILIAPNAFKNSLDAATAAEAISRGILSSRKNIMTSCFPVGDGGDGTGKLLMEHLNAESKSVIVSDPLRQPISASFGFLKEEGMAIIELAEASGLRLLKASEYNPMITDTFGTGQLMKAAISNGAKKIILTIGGSATVDGGVGILRALDYRFLSHEDKEIYHPSEFQQLARIVFPSTTNLRQVELTILCDVQNPLIGPTGAAEIFSPQKGATPIMIDQLEKGLNVFSAIVMKQTGISIDSIPHGGASGGVAAGLYGLAGAKLVNGIDYFLEITKFRAYLQKASLVITGEGSLDRQTLDGKAPFGVATMAKQLNIPVIGIAGRIEADAELSKYFDQLICINNGTDSLIEQLANCERNLEQTGRAIALAVE